MTDAEEPEVITQLLHSEECGRSVLYDVYGNAICIIAAILNHIDALTRERDEARKDTARLNWLESAHTLQNNVEILYVVDGYNVDVMHHNGATCHQSLHGATLREALDFARAAFAQGDA
jgi:hypothetical protein